MSRKEHHSGDASGTPSAPRPVQLTPRSVPTGDQASADAAVSLTGSSAGLRQFATLATNVAVVTALLVYFGWRRAETEAVRLGVDESIFGLSTRDYLLRSVGPVLQLLAIVAVAGLAAVYLDRGLRRRAEHHGPTDRVVRLALLGMSIAWLLLPLLVFALGNLAPAIAFVAFPLAIAAGVLLLVYSTRLRHELRGQAPQPIGWRHRVEWASVAVALCVTIFWATSNYAEVLGNHLADETINHVRDLTAVTVYAPQRLGISAPGTRETLIPGARQTYRYRYTGLRLLVHTGGRYFLIPDLWKPESGAVIMLKDSSPLRFEFGATSIR